MICFQRGKKALECECKIPLIKQSFLAMDKHPILDNVAEFLTFNSNQKPSRAARPAAMRCSNVSIPFRCWYFTSPSGVSMRGIRLKMAALELANCPFLGSTLKGVVPSKRGGFTKYFYKVHLKTPGNLTQMFSERKHTSRKGSAKYLYEATKHITSSARVVAN